ncbi:hypothetical protein G3M48_000855 [Beauveria asiatica]|uniref:Uncharacterized protein n=1 Tax=Beauveria asiatica TaxID=1069075 RepID=A0AAW0RGM4_9HYPO
MRHDVRGSSFPSLPPTEANYETQLCEADTLYTFLSVNSALPPDELNSDSGYASANHAAQDDGAGRGPWVDDSRFGPPTDFLTLDYMPSSHNELNSDGGYASANHAAQDDGAGRGPRVDDSRFGPPTDFLTLDYMPSSHNELYSDNEFAFANCETTAEINLK